jgi:hypothetical protein
MKTMLHEVRGSMMINVQGDMPLADADWDEFLAAAAAAPRLTAYFISADNYGPDARQRAKLATLPHLYPLPKAVVTTSLAVRGIVTATSWLGTNIRAFAPSRVDDAFDYLGVARPNRAALLECVALLKTRLAGGEGFGSLRPPAGPPTSDVMLVNRIIEERVANIRAKIHARGIAGKK